MSELLAVDAKVRCEVVTLSTGGGRVTLRPFGVGEGEHPAFLLYINPEHFGFFRPGAVYEMTLSQTQEEAEQ